MKIGIICGNIGSGKSSVAKELRKMGYPVVDADCLTKSIYRNAPEVYGTVTSIWGPDAIALNGSLSQEVRDIALKDSDAYNFLMGIIRAPMATALCRIFHTVVNERRYMDKMAFIESAVMDAWMYDWVFPQRNIDNVFRITVPNAEERLNRVVSRYVARNHLYGFAMLPPEQEMTQDLIAEYRKMVELTDAMQTNLYNKWLGSSDPHFPEPVEMVNDELADVKRIAERIAEIAKT